MIPWRAKIDDDGADVVGHVGIQAPPWLIEEEHLGLMGAAPGR